MDLTNPMTLDLRLERAERDEVRDLKNERDEA